MKNKIESYITSVIVLSSFFVILIFPTLAFAEDLPNIDGLLESIATKNYPFLVAFSLSIVIWFCRRFSFDSIPAKYTPYIVLTLSILGGVSTGIIMYVGDGNIWWHGLIKGFIEGLSAGLMSMGFWSSGLKKVLKVNK